MALNGMSVQPSGPDIGRLHAQVRLVPIAEVISLTRSPHRRSSTMPEGIPVQAILLFFD